MDTVNVYYVKQKHISVAGVTQTCLELSRDVENLFVLQKTLCSNV